jgi:hypothetical protein
LASTPQKQPAPNVAISVVMFSPPASCSQASYSML